MLSLPLDVVKIIFRKLLIQDKLNFRSTCKRYCNLQPILVNGKYHSLLNDSILKTLPKLVLLVIDNSRITDKGLSYVQDLACLSIWKNSVVSNKGLQKLKKIKLLSISDKKKISDIGLEHLCQLKYLYISGCTKLTTRIIANNTNLQYLQLYGKITKNIDDSILKLLVNLKVLILCNERFKLKITNYGLSHLNNLRLLYLVNYDDCITNETIQKMENIEYVLVLCGFYFLKKPDNIPHNCIWIDDENFDTDFTNNNLLTIRKKYSFPM